MKTSSVLVLILALITACDSSDNSVNNEINKNEIKAPSILDAQTDALDKAKSVENSVLEAAKERNRIMEEQGI